MKRTLVVLLILIVGSMAKAGSNTATDAAARVFDVRDYGIIANNPAEENNNTTKMNKLLSELLAVHGGTVYFPEKGIYYLSCKIPDNAHPGTFIPSPIKFKGGTPPFLAQGTVVSGLVRQNNEWTIIRTTTETPAIDASGSGYQWLVYMEDIECQSTGKAPVCVNLHNSSQASLHQTLITNGTWGNMSSWPIENIGLTMPPVNNGGLNTLDDVCVVGFRVGVRPGEHLVASHLLVYYCQTGIQHYSNHHVNIIQRYQTGHNQYDFVTVNEGGASTSRITINQFDVESGANTIANIYDPSSTLVGNIVWSSVRAGFGVWKNFVAIGTNPAQCKIAEIGLLFKENDQPGTLLAGARRLYPTSNHARWGQSGARDIWYSYQSSCDLGLTNSASVNLAAGANGWIAQQYNAASRGAFVGFKTPSAQVIGFTVDQTGTIIAYPGTGSGLNSNVKAVDGAFYRLKRSSGTYTIESTTNDGKSWTLVYTVPSPFGGAAPAGAYSAYMQQGVLTSNQETAAGVYYPQGDF